MRVRVDFTIETELDDEKKVLELAINIIRYGARKLKANIKYVTAEETEDNYLKGSK